ncbi:hypothetical protein [Nocardia sp. CA-120079]|uniref:hypothetical protein n=1 Tax=Nocardia sp. CA-120079 TaxID=3239974 RepID=UPI003D998612
MPRLTHPTDDDTVSARVQNAIDQSGRSVDAIAADSGIPAKVLKAYLRRERSWRVTAIVTVALVLDVSPLDMFGAPEWIDIYCSGCGQLVGRAHAPAPTVSIQCRDCRERDA